VLLVSVAAVLETLTDATSPPALEGLPLEGRAVCALDLILVLEQGVEDGRFSSSESTPRSIYRSTPEYATAASIGSSSNDDR
jgi:hypothetical protein